MKIKQYNEMMAYLTRPGNPQEIKKSEEVNKPVVNNGNIQTKKIEPREQEILKKGNPYPTQATPEQVGQLAERLELNAQMTGGKGPFTDKQKPKPIVKKDPVTNYTEFKIDPIISDPNSALPPELPEPVQSRVNLEDNPKYRNTIFGSDSYYRRMRGIDD